MPIRAAIISYDASGAPTLLADPRTPADEQRKQMVGIKLGLTPPPVDAARIEFLTWNSEAVERWMPIPKPVVAAPEQAETENKTSKKKDKSK